MLVDRRFSKEEIISGFATVAGRRQGGTILVPETAWHAGSIYVWCEPGTWNVRYVGKTIQSPHTRYSGYMRKARGSRYNRPVFPWLRAHLHAGRTPDFHVLLTGIALDVILDTEQECIRWCRSNGFDLLNVR